MTEAEDARPSRDSILMEVAEAWSKRSTCNRAHVGAVIATREYRTLVNGYNGTPAGMLHCDHKCIGCPPMLDHLNRPLSQIVHFSHCPEIQPCVNAVHAEANCIAWAARSGVALQDSQLFTTLGPCRNCAMLIINAGIHRVVYAADHRDTTGVELLARMAIEVVKYEYDEQSLCS